MKKSLLTLSSLVLAMTLSAPHALAGNEDLNSPTVQKLNDHTLKGPVNFYKGIEPGNADGTVNVVVEIPTGTTGKWEVNPDTGELVWEMKKGKPRVVDYQGGYPANYGTVPKTAMPKEYGGDGESVDIVVLGDAIPRGEVVKVKLIGILNLKEGDDFDAKLLGVREGSPMADAKSPQDLNARFNGILDKVSSWFENYKGPDAGLKVEGIGGADAATEILTVSIEAYAAANK